MALALMSILLYQYNSRFVEQNETNAVESIDCQQREQNLESIDNYCSPFGIVDKGVHADFWGTDKLGNTQFHCLSDDFTSQQKTVLNEVVQQFITVEQIMVILEKAVKLSNAALAIQSKSYSLKYQFFPFMSSFILVCVSITQQLIHALKQDWIL